MPFAPSSARKRPTHSNITPSVPVHRQSLNLKFFPFQPCGSRDPSKLQMPSGMLYLPQSLRGVRSLPFHFNLQTTRFSHQWLGSTSLISPSCSLRLVFSSNWSPKALSPRQSTCENRHPSTQTLVNAFLAALHLPEAQTHASPQVTGGFCQTNDGMQAPGFKLSRTVRYHICLQFILHTWMFTHPLVGVSGVPENQFLS